MSGCGISNNRLEFGGNPDHNADSQFLIRNTITKSTLFDCASRFHLAHCVNSANVSDVWLHGNEESQTLVGQLAVMYFSIPIKNNFQQRVHIKRHYYYR